MYLTISPESSIFSRRIKTLFYFTNLIIYFKNLIKILFYFKNLKSCIYKYQCYQNNFSGWKYSSVGYLPSMHNDPSSIPDTTKRKKDFLTSHVLLWAKWVLKRKIIKIWISQFYWAEHFLWMALLLATLVKKSCRWGMMAHICNPSTQETEARRITMNSQPVWATQVWIQGHPGLHSKTLLIHTNIPTVETSIKLLMKLKYIQLDTH